MKSNVLAFTLSKGLAILDLLYANIRDLNLTRLLFFVVSFIILWPTGELYFDVKSPADCVSGC